jgi:hypothetical protein
VEMLEMLGTLGGHWRRRNLWKQSIGDLNEERSTGDWQTFSRALKAQWSVDSGLVLTDCQFDRAKFPMTLIGCRIFSFSSDLLRLSKARHHNS